MKKYQGIAFTANLYNIGRNLESALELPVAVCVLQSGLSERTTDASWRPATVKLPLDPDHSV